MTKPEMIHELSFCALFSDGTMGFSDGVGFIGSEEREEVYELYKKLKDLFEPTVKEGETPWQGNCLMCGGVHGSGLPCPQLNPTAGETP